MTWDASHLLPKAQTDTCSPQCMSAAATDPASRAKHCQGLGLINRWPDTEQKHKANKGKGREQKKNGGEMQATMRNTNENMADSHPSTRSGPTLFNLVKSAPKSKQSPSVSRQSKESDSQSRPKRKLVRCWMRQYQTMQHCGRNANYYSYKSLCFT